MPGQPKTERNRCVLLLWSLGYDKMDIYLLLKPWFDGITENAVHGVIWRYA